MNYFNPNMIRPIRLLFVRNNCNVFLFTQRAKFLSNQSIMEFGIYSDVEKKFKKKTLLQENSTLPNIVSNNLVKGEIRKAELFEGESNVNNFLNNTVNYPACDIIKILKTLAESNNRSVVIIRNLCDLLYSKEKELTLKECSDLLYALAKLSFRHEPVITAVAAQLKSAENFESGVIIKSLLQSFSGLRYRDCELLDKMTKFLLSQQNNFDVKHSLSVLLSLSFLNFSPPYVDNLIKPLSALESTDFFHTKDFINFIWACVILNKLNIIPEKHILYVLSENFLEKLSHGVQKIHTGMKLKLLNINAAASLLPFFKGPNLMEFPQYKLISPIVSGERTVFQESVRDSFSYIVPKGKEMKLNVNTGFGLYIDIEVYLDPADWPYRLPKNPENTKLGIILLNFNDLCTDNSLTGISAFKLNILKSFGYNLLAIPYTEYPLKSKLSEKIVYLRNKIKDLIIFRLVRIQESKIIEAFLHWKDPTEKLPEEKRILRNILFACARCENLSFWQKIKPHCR